MTDLNDKGGVFFLVSLPVEGNAEQTKSQLDRSGMANGNMNTPSKPFPIPRDLRVGTLDTLVALSDRLIKDDLFAEGLCRKLAHQMNQLVDRNKDKMLEMLQANGRPLQGCVRPHPFVRGVGVWVVGGEGRVTD
jgi:hypothetical protein